MKAPLERDREGRIRRATEEVEARPWVVRGHDRAGIYAKCLRCGTRADLFDALEAGDRPALYDFELLHSLCDGQERLL